MSLVVEGKSATHGGLRVVVGRCMGMFYADDGMIGWRGPEWIQGDINVLVILFRRVGLMANVAKSNTMTCQPGAICTGISEEAFSWNRKGEGSTYQELLWWCITCPYCGVELRHGSIMDRHRWLHGTEPSIDWYQLPVRHIEHLPLVYEVGFLTNIQSCQCPFPGYPGTSWSRSGIQNHSSRLHLGFSILILEEHTIPSPYFERFKRQVPPWLLNNFHYNTKAFRLVQELQDENKHFKGNSRKTRCQSRSIWSHLRQPHCSRN